MNLSRFNKESTNNAVYYIPSNDGRHHINNDIYIASIVIGNPEKLEKFKDSILSMRKCERKMERVVINKRQRTQNRILSNQREKMEYSLKCPRQIRNIIGETKGNIEVTEVRSKKFFNLCNKFAIKANIKFPRVSSSVSKLSSLTNACIDDFTKATFSPKFHLRSSVKDNIKTNKTYEKDNTNKNKCNDFKCELNSISSRILDKEKCQINYKTINEKMRFKVSNARINRHLLFTFDPSKLKLPA